MYAKEVTAPFISSTSNKAARVTIKSTIEIIEFLLNAEELENRFKYVLTGKLNQDCLEVLQLTYLCAVQHF